MIKVLRIVLKARAERRENSVVCFRTKGQTRGYFDSAPALLPVLDLNIVKKKP